MRGQTQQRSRNMEHPTQSRPLSLHNKSQKSEESLNLSSDDSHDRAEEGNKLSINQSMLDALHSTSGWNTKPKTPMGSSKVTDFTPTRSAMHSNNQRSTFNYGNHGPSAFDSR